MVFIIIDVKYIYIDLFAYVLKIRMALIHMHVVPGHERFFSAFASSSGERVPGKTYAATAMQISQRTFFILW